jgi:osmoprotectant transport system permease protein
VKVGSKKFTESVILGEMVSLLAGDGRLPARHYRELGGTQLVFQALRNGDIDIYPEYSGTIRSEILAGRALAGSAEVATALREMGVLMSRPLGFIGLCVNNAIVSAKKGEVPIGGCIFEGGGGIP